jgi:hypothetical protein
MITTIIGMMTLTNVSPPLQAVDLNRLYKQGERLEYDFSSRIQMDIRQVPLETFMPFSQRFNYTYTLETERLKPDGIADVRFKRNIINVRMGETYDSPPKDEVIKANNNYLFTMSGKNSIISIKDDSPKDDKKLDHKPVNLFLVNAYPAFLQFDVGGWMWQIRSMAGFVNFFDLGPVLPLREVEVGGTWKDTVGYAPTTIQTGADKGKNVVARLDKVYTYKGMTEHEGKRVVWVQGTVNQNTDAAPLIAEMLGVDIKRAPFSEIKIQFDATIDFYLEPSNLTMFRVRAGSEGYISVTIPQITGPVYEEKFKSTALLKKK